MKSNVSKEVTFTLTLNEDEAEWLRNVVQNPIHGTFETESEHDAGMRKKFWDALSYDKMEVNCGNN